MEYLCLILLFLSAENYWFFFFEELEHTYVIVSIKLWLINRLNAVYLNGNMLLTTDNKHHIYIFYNPPEAK